MALVNTEQKENIKPLQSVASILRALRGAAADELSAQNLYSGMIDDLKAAGHKGSIIDTLNEIMIDEVQHLGKLLSICGELDNSFTDNLKRGSEGE